MMILFFIGIGASSIMTALADSPIEIAMGLLAISALAAIYHPAGLALVVQEREKTGVPLAIKSCCGNVSLNSRAGF